MLGRNLQLVTPSKEWLGNDRVLLGNSIKFKSKTRPFIGVSENSPHILKSFLRQNGYIIENNGTNAGYSIFLDQEIFLPEDEKPLLAKLENLDQPLIRFGVWPNECKSALCVTGDIDALTVGDYLLRAWRN